MFQSFVEPPKKGLSYDVNEMTHGDFIFYLKALSGSLGGSFFFNKNWKRDCENDRSWNCQSIQTQSLHLLLQNVPLWGKLPKKVVVNNRRRTKSAAVQLVLQPTYSKKLPIGDKKKADILDLLRKKSYSYILCYFLWVSISIIIITLQLLFVILLFCFFLNYDTNVIINVWNNVICH